MRFPANKNYQKIRTLDMHTGGEPLRIIMEGYPAFKGKSILQIRRELKSEYDHLRRFIMWEPRGHADMYGLLKVPAQREDSDFGVIFMHNEGYSTMCGHATIAIARAAIDLGWVEMHAPSTSIKIDAPCGQITAHAMIENDEVVQTSFINVPSFYVGTYFLNLPGLGNISYDLAYGGAFYAYVDVKQIDQKCHPNAYSELIRLGKSIKAEVIKTNSDIEHPFESDLSFLYGVIFIEESTDPEVHSKNVCVFADGEVDRCATGSGVSGRAAIHYAKGELEQFERIRIESIIGSSLELEIQEKCDYGPYEAVIPKVYGMAYYTGSQEFWMDPSDPFKDGFILR